ncbi:hypothetical protein Lal_00017049 [Lupinus albus]|nr:hypothetical protein Lal_00017049 [Lupinus albus]
MEAVSSTRLGRASSRYGTPAVFSGPVRKWKKKWVHVPSPTSSSSALHNKSHPDNTNTNTNSCSRLLLRRWTPITAAYASDDDPHNSSATFSDEPPRRKFRYTPFELEKEQCITTQFHFKLLDFTLIEGLVNGIMQIAALEEHKNVVIEKAEFEPTTENDILTARQRNVTHQMHVELKINEIFEDAKDSDISQLDLGLGIQGNNGEKSQNGDDRSEKKCAPPKSLRVTPAPIDGLEVVAKLAPSSCPIAPIFVVLAPPPLIVNAIASCLTKGSSSRTSKSRRGASQGMMPKSSKKSGKHKSI